MVQYCIDMGRVNIMMTFCRFLIIFGQAQNYLQKEREWDHTYFWYFLKLNCVSFVLFSFNIKDWEISAKGSCSCSVCFYGYHCSFHSVGDVFNLIPFYTQLHDLKFLLYFFEWCILLIAGKLQFFFYPYWRPIHLNYLFCSFMIFNCSFLLACHRFLCWNTISKPTCIQMVSLWPLW
jgi:hypothetical protein